MKNLALWCLMVAAGLWYPVVSAHACSCSWNGPFLTVSKDAPLIIHGRIIRHHSGQSPTMDVRVLGTLKGGLLDSGMVVQMGDGMQCRPTLEGFPPDSEWILALNGPGSKPGNGWALSHCGEYWLRVEKGEVIGSIDGKQSELKRMPLNELKSKIRYSRFHTTFKGKVSQGERFERPFGEQFVFVLEPMPGGWKCHQRTWTDETGTADHAFTVQSGASKVASVEIFRVHSGSISDAVCQQEFIFLPGWKRSTSKLGIRGGSRSGDSAFWSGVLPL